VSFTFIFSIICKFKIWSQKKRSYFLHPFWDQLSLQWWYEFGIGYWAIIQWIYQYLCKSSFRFSLL